MRWSRPAPGLHRAGFNTSAFCCAELSLMRPADPAGAAAGDERSAHGSLSAVAGVLST